MSKIHEGASPAHARTLTEGKKVLAAGKWRTVSTISEACNNGVHFRTDVGSDDERHFVTNRNTPWWVRDEVK